MEKQIPTFWVEQTNKVQQYLRRFSRRGHCEGSLSYHNARVPFAVVEQDPNTYVTINDSVPHDHPLWPTKCEHCDYTFADDDHWQCWSDRIMCNTSTDETYPLEDVPVGGMWNAWFHQWICSKTEDGISLMVRTPGGDWSVDGRANNCTKPNYVDHFCWCRHGDPRMASVTVDKVGRTCGAGAGSFATPKWHGWLRNGMLISC